MARSRHVEDGPGPATGGGWGRHGRRPLARCGWRLWQHRMPVDGARLREALLEPQLRRVLETGCVSLLPKRPRGRDGRACRVRAPKPRTLQSRDLRQVRGVKDSNRLRRQRRHAPRDDVAASLRTITNVVEKCLARAVTSKACRALRGVHEMAHGSSLAMSIELVNAHGLRRVE